MKKEVRKAVIAGNWKMNMTPSQAKTLIDGMIPLVKDADCEVIVGVPFVDIETAVKACEGTDIAVAAQNCHWEKSGAFTGEISADMLTEAGVKYVIIGHSERRQYFGETDATVNKRVRAVLDAGLSVILCVGEVLAERENGVTPEVVRLQTKIALNGVSADELSRVIIAYEPVWAIGTGKVATAEQAQEVCGEIRALLGELYSEAAAESVTIQYGGSMNASNAAELLANTDVDGGLIGGASLKADAFAEIVKAASK